MGKQDEFVVKKKSRAIRKRLRRDGGATAHSRHALEAANRRRKAGARRICEGMCYTLPTPEDPFNERCEKRKGGNIRKAVFPSFVGNSQSLSRASNFVPATSTHILQQQENIMEKKTSNAKKRGHAEKKAEYFQINGGVKKIKVDKNIDALNTMRQGNGDPSSIQEHTARGKPLMPKSYSAHTSEKDSSAIGTMRAPITPQGIHFTSRARQVIDIAKHLRVILGGVGDDNEEAICKLNIGTCFQKQCWEALETGSNVLGSCQDATERILSYVPIVVSHIVHKHVLQRPDENPIVLVLVTSQVEALHVRRYFLAFKKNWSIHSVCLHTGTGIERQVEGLSLRMPEVIVATPDRLSDLLRRKFISLSSIALLVIDSLEDMIVNGFVEQLNFIQSKLKMKVQSFVLTGSYSLQAIKLIQCIVKDPILRVAFEQSTPFQSACISQIVTVVVSNEKKVFKLCKLLKHKLEKKESQNKGGFLVFVQTKETASHILEVLKNEGLSVEAFFPEQENNLLPTEAMMERLRTAELQVLILKNKVGYVDLSRIQTIVYYDFASIHEYTDTLATMARYSSYGELHSICTSSMAPLALELIEVLHSCWQPVPKALQMLADAYSCLHSN